MWLPSWRWCLVLHGLHALVRRYVRLSWICIRFGLLVRHSGWQGAFSDIPVGVAEVHPLHRIYGWRSLLLRSHACSTTTHASNAPSTRTGTFPSSQIQASASFPSTRTPGHRSPSFPSGFASDRFRASHRSPPLSSRAPQAHLVAVARRADAPSHRRPRAMASDRCLGGIAPAIPLTRIDPV